VRLREKEVCNMKNISRLALAACLLAAAAMVSCSSSSDGDICGNKEHAYQDDLVISGLGMHDLITSPPADKNCPVTIVVEYRYNDGIAAEQGRPDNVELIFTMEDSGPPDTLTAEDPQPTEEDNMKFWSVRLMHTARSAHSNPVYYSVQAGSPTVELPEIYLAVDIEYVPHSTTY
jgi:hypothetical protein